MVHLSDAARRSLRTLYHAAIALITLVPAGLALLPSGSPLAAKGAVIAAGVAAVAGVINKLEDAGLIPAWLKADTAAPSAEDTALAAAPAPAADAPVQDDAPAAQ